MALTHAWHDMRDEMHDLATFPRVDAARQAYLGLWATFIVLPLVFGLDKLFGFMTDGWEGYLATWANDALPGSASTAMTWFGVVEIALAACVLLLPRVGGDLFAIWMVLVAINLFTIDDMAHLAVAALAFAACAAAMARMSTAFHHTEATHKAF